MFLYHLRSCFVLNLVMLEVFKLFRLCPKSFVFLGALNNVFTSVMSGIFKPDVRI